MKSILQNLKMNRKIMAAPLIVMVFMIVIAAISYRGMSNQKGALDDIFTIRFQTYQDASQMITQMTTVNKNVYRLLGLANSGMDAAKVDGMGKELLKEMGDIKALVKNTTAKPLDPQEKSLLDGVVKEIETYEKMLLQVRPDDGRGRRHGDHHDEPHRKPFPGAQRQTPGAARL